MECGLSWGGGDRKRYEVLVERLLQGTGREALGDLKLRGPGGYVVGGPLGGPSLGPGRLTGTQAARLMQAACLLGSLGQLSISPGVFTIWGPSDRAASPGTPWLWVWRHSHCVQSLPAWAPWTGKVGSPSDASDARGFRRLSGCHPQSLPGDAWAPGLSVEDCLSRVEVLTDMVLVLRDTAR